VSTPKSCRIAIGVKKYKAQRLTGTAEFSNALLDRSRGADWRSDFAVSSIIQAGGLMSQEDFEARDKFLFTLEWLLAVTRRHSGGLQFGLAHINYETPKILGETYGAQKASQKLDEVSHSLRNAFRKSDLVARDGTDFWILVPFAPADEKLVDKIKYIIDTASQGGLQIVERDISIFLLPIDSADTAGLDAKSTAMEFLTYLKKNHIALSSHELALPARE
jgi:GGDEF domain-containing protein